MGERGRDMVFDFQDCVCVCDRQAGRHGARERERKRETHLQSLGKQIGINKIHFKIDGLDVV